MRKILVLITIFIISCTQHVLAAKLPSDVVNYINKSVPNADIRFDGVVILPDNTLYLPLYPALFSDIDTLCVKESYPAKKELKDKPDLIIFNNDFVLMKVLTDSNGRRTVLHLNPPPLQVRTGLLPQDMLVPSGLIIPENIKGIIGNLKIDTQNEDIIKLSGKESFEEFIDKNNTTQTIIPQLKGKTVFISTNYSKNIQVLEPAKANPIYSLAQKSIPINIRSIQNGKYILVTSFERPFLDVISVADSRFIKQINFPAFPHEILVDANKIYITIPSISSIYVIDIKTMSLSQKIKINGYCEKLLLKDNKLFYVDKLKNDIWAIELNNEYKLVNIGRFPNISSIAYADNKIYLASRTKSRIAVVDYVTQGLISEFTTVNKPVAMKLYKNLLYILGAQNNIIQVVNTKNDTVVNNIELGSNGFSTGFFVIENTSLGVITDVKKNTYTIIDMASGKILCTYSVNVPVNEVIITDKVKLF